ncbi:MAG: hypothetical protein ACK45T_19810 [Pseudanabaena sp.]|nr:hypothetical protein [Pseudanabaena sp. M34BS1SP1A06MG]MCA6602688.1 hypothetical protein [Pseudanabaena sp. M57BS1SP1A06MG]MCA6606319.1 hypothetical protein [Pseudanabaena sp. M007S1SP1A06QC]
MIHGLVKPIRIGLFTISLTPKPNILKAIGDRIQNLSSSRRSLLLDLLQN